MNITNLWAVPIAESILDIDIDRTLDYISNLPYENDEGVNCEYTVSKYLHNDSNLDYVVSKIETEANIYASEILGYTIDSPDYKIAMKNMWGVKMKPHDYAARHYHAQSLFSGILYLSVDSNESNKIRFHTPYNNNSFVRIPINKWNEHNCYEYWFPPTVGKLLFFPANIDHSADVNMSNETLYSIIFDFSVKGVLGKNTTCELSFE